MPLFPISSHFIVWWGVNCFYITQCWFESGIPGISSQIIKDLYGAPSRQARHQLNNQVIIVTVIVVFCCLRYIFHEYLMNTCIRQHAPQLSNNFTNHFQYFLLQHAPDFQWDETIVAVMPADVSVHLQWCTCESSHRHIQHHGWFISLFEVSQRGFGLRAPKSPKETIDCLYWANHWC